MSQILINQYLNDLDRYKKISGSLTEGIISEAFKDLLKDWSRQANLHFINQYEFVSTQKTRIRPDGTILHDLRVPLGYWEAKDTNDDLDAEIAKKLTKGYPQDNIIFEDSVTAVLIQNRHEVFRCKMVDKAELLKLLKLFFGYERAEIAEFRKAVEQFKADIPFVLEALREKINDAYSTNAPFNREAEKFLAQAKNTINPSVTEADVREMLIQHILTEEIFAHVFDQGDFHRENNIAQKLYALEAKFFTGQIKRETLKGLEAYYSTIRANAALITSHSEKQNFLKVIYENFYKVYDKKKADRLGVVYTPNEIVKFMIEGADWLCQKHFGKNLIDDHVEILDPATGTGTFICELLEHFRGQPQKLAHKYKNELHANEVAILPYYVANLNIEATYAAITGQFAEYPNLCFVDTLDNVAGLGIKAGYQHDMFAGMSEENVERVKRQNKRKISVIIGNPPYNANQANENDNNKNREYKRIDELIKSSYIRLSTAQKTKVYDMYARFFRWASDRMHDDGVLAFVSNSSFVDSRTFDGFRKSVANDFHEIYIVDLKGNARTSGDRRRREGGNIFDDQIRVGIAISFFVKKRKASGSTIRYEAVRDYAKSDEKRGFLASKPLSQRPFEIVRPDKNGNWINQTLSDWDHLIPVADKKTKAAKTKGQEKAIFRRYSQGLKTNRDEWVIDQNASNTGQKVRFLIDHYNQVLKEFDFSKFSKTDAPNTTIKWTRKLNRNVRQRVPLRFSGEKISSSIYRPFVKSNVYYDKILNEDLYQLDEMFPSSDSKNLWISFVEGKRLDFMVFAGEIIPNYALISLDPIQITPRYRYAKNGEQIDNITDWGLKQFQTHYGKDTAISKDNIFHYVYGVLHDPLYREKYAQNLKRESPRIPYYPNFHKWAEWGKSLMDIHINYETVEPWPLTRIDTPDEKARAAGVQPKAALKADLANGTIRLDTETILSGIPESVWTYRLGNRSGLEWILDQYKEKTPKDPTIREKFNTYRFADYKEKVIDLLMRVTRVSVETMEIIGKMKSAKRD
ncbi:type ISP restriction/modification enzyme [Phyllobacterium sp. YR531]|uniref:type ISP restriction/modification enzyme n=1 Tax=Phyllobacterium sp. YR531 TaxID=1144343 RepID=UPI00026FAA2B|nr:type ISP restriction/modification enzyme [Phyllobacterium sp. YR531]EJN00600.1 putative helicase [Phyllobacterium sp. YR531]